MDEKRNDGVDSASIAYWGATLDSGGVKGGSVRGVLSVLLPALIPVWTFF